MKKNLKQILIRTTSYDGYGSGHLKRSILLAKKINELYGKVSDVVIAVEGDKQAFQIANKSKIKYIKLPINVNLDNELNEYSERINFLILDIFDISPTNEKKYKEIADYLIVFSDMGTPSFYSDILISPQIHNFVVQKSHNNQLVLEGPNFFIFDDSCLKIPKKDFNKIAKFKIFICIGGYSNDDVLNNICIALNSNANLRAEVIFITGYNCKVDINNKIQNKNIDIKIMDYVENPLKLLSQSDFAIISGGHIKYEAAGLGIPSIIIGLVMHQDILSKAFEKSGACIYLGLSSLISYEDISRAVENLSSNNKKLKLMSKSAFNLVDGMGAERVVKSIFNLR